MSGTRRPIFRPKSKRKSEDKKTEKVEKKKSTTTKSSLNFSSSIKESLDSKSSKPKAKVSKKIFESNEDFQEQKILGSGAANEEKEKEVARELEIYKQLGLKNNEIEDAYEERSEIMKYNKTVNLYGKHIYTLEDLKKIALDYRLQLGPTRQYVKKISSNAAKDIASFSERHNIQLDSGSRDRFYILAPREDFNKENSNSKRDPFILYRTQYSYYVPVYDPNEKYTIFRYLRSQLMRNTLYLRFCTILIGLLVGLNLGIMIFGIGIGFSVLGMLGAGIGGIIAAFYDGTLDNLSSKSWKREEY